MPDIKQRAHKMFDELCNSLSVSEFLDSEFDRKAKSFIDEIIDMRDKEIVEEILSSFEALDKAGQSFPMAIIHWSKQDRENWVKSKLSAEAVSVDYGFKKDEAIEALRAAGFSEEEAERKVKEWK